MSSQIQITGETKVKSLTGVLVGTSGVVSSLNIDGSLGIPQLDVNGKIIVSQLPNSVMEYKGVWNAAANSPTLTNGGAFSQGDVYLCDTAGTVNFGAGPIAFVVSDQVIYSGSIWQKASGTNGTVTSVGLSTNAGAITIGSSPITTSGTITANFNGTNLQYVNGAGNLTTFPILTGYVTAVSGTAPVVSSGGTTPAISMAAATGSVDGYLSATDFAIFNAKQSALTFSSPLVNTSGTISIPAATTSVNGYLASADFTTFNNKQNTITLTTTGSSGASTLVGATLNIPNYGSALTGYVPYTGATQDVDLGAFKLNAQSLHIKGTAGNGHLGLKHQSASATASANEVSLFADSLGDLAWQNGNLYLSKFIISGNTANRSYTFPNATCNIPDDSLVVHLAGTETITGAKTFSGLTSFTFSSGTRMDYGPYLIKGSVPIVFGSSTTNIYSDATTNNIVIRDNLSIAKLEFNNSTQTYTFPAASGTIALVGGSGVGTVTSVAALTIGTTGTDLSSTVATSTTTPVITLNVPTASAANRGALSSADWTTFNNKQSALTNPVTGTGTTNYLPKFTGASTIGNSAISDNGSLVSVGLNTLFSGYIDGLGLRATSSSAFGGTGVGVEIGYSGGLGYIQAYNRSTSAYQPIKVDGSTVSLQISGVEKLGIASTGAATFSSTLQVGGNASSTITIGDAVASGTDANLRLRTGSTKYSWLIASQNNIAGFEITPSTTVGGTTYSTPALSILPTGAATFSGNVGLGAISSYAKFNISTGDDNQMALGTTSVGQTVGIYLADGPTTSSVGYKWEFGKTTANNFFIYSYGTASNVLSIAYSTGAATFSSSVTATGFFESSDSRLKTLIQDNYQTKGIASITPKLYTKNGKVELGYYAQDFVGILDSAVSKGSDDMLSLSYREVLVAKVYALEQEIKELKAKMN